MSNYLPCVHCKLEASPSVQKRITLHLNDQIGSIIKDNSTLSDRGVICGTLRIAIDTANCDKDITYSETIKLNLNCYRNDDIQAENISKLSLPISWKIVPLISAKPSRLYLGKCKQGELVTTHILLSDTSDKPSDFLKARVDCDLDALLASRISKVDDHHARLALSLHMPRNAQGIHQSKIKITLNNDKILILPLSVILE